MNDKLLFENIGGNKFRIANESSPYTHLTGIDEQNLEESIIELRDRLKVLFQAAVETEDKNTVLETTETIDKFIKIVTKKTELFKAKKSQTPPSGLGGIKNDLRGMGFSG